MQYDTPAALTPEEDEISEASLSRITSKFKVVLFGVGKTMFAPPDQPALQILLQYRNLYEMSIADMRTYVDRSEPIPKPVHDRTTKLLFDMWTIIRTCMQEFNKAVANKAKLISAEKMTIMRINPQRVTVPNPGYDVPSAPDTPNTQDQELIVLDPAEPHV